MDNICLLPGRAVQNALLEPEKLSAADIRSIVDGQRIALRALDRQVAELLQGKHTSKDSEKLRGHVIASNRQLVDISYLLEDRIKADKADKQTQKFQKEIWEECKILIARNEAIARSLGEDILICQNKEAKALIPIAAVMFLPAFPVAMASLVTILTSEKAPQVGDILKLSIFAALVLAFPRQVLSAWKAAKVIAKRTAHKPTLVAILAFKLEAGTLTKGIPAAAARGEKQKLLPYVQRKCGL